MEEATVVIRHVNQKAFRAFKARCAEAGLTLGRAASEAFRGWFPGKARKKKSMLDFEPVDMGPGTENLSRRIDELAFRD